MGQSHSTVADQSDTLTLGFLPPSPHESSGTLSTLAVGASAEGLCHYPTNRKTAAAANGDDDEMRKTGPTNPPNEAAASAGSAAAAAAGSARPTSPTRTKPRFLGMFRRVHLPHAPHPHLPHINVPHPHVPHLSSSVKKTTTSMIKRAPPTKSVDARPTALARRGPKPKSLLADCASPSEHYDRIDAVMERTRGLKGAMGLRAAGFGYRLVHCPTHQQNGDACGHACAACVTRLHYQPPTSAATCSEVSSSSQKYPIVITPTNRSKYIADGIMYEEIARLCQEYAQERMAKEGGLVWVTVCDDEELGDKIRCLVPRGHRLHDRNEDDEDDDNGKSSDPAAAPLDASSPILLITTGKGKVRAGVFSRQHLMTTALEPATALPIVREARRRGMRCVIPDPNCRGDRNGMETYKRSISRIFEEVDDDNNIDDDGDIDDGDPDIVASDGREEEAQTGTISGSVTPDCSCKDVPIYVLAHSASGAHFVRYLRDHSPSRDDEPSDEGDDVLITPALINRIRAVAFTDSTHNIQWTRKDSAHKKLESMLEGDASLYVRVEPEGSGGSGLAAAPSTRNGRRSLRAATSQEDEDASIFNTVVPRESSGRTADTDQYWRHRFGSVKTVWAGTGDHSLTNWAAHGSIWEHFDRHRNSDGKPS